MLLNFLHPATSDLYEADVEPQCRAQDAVTGLIQAGFIEPNPRGNYDLVLARTQTQILPEQTFGAVGAQHGDSIALHRRGQGAA